MGDKFDRSFRDAFLSSRNRNAVRTRGNYGEHTFLSVSSDGNDLGRSGPIMDAISKREGFQGGDELSRQVKLPCQNASHLDLQNHYDGSECVKPPINSEFDNFGGRREDYTIHVWGIDSQRGSNTRDKHQQPANSEEENRINTGTQMMLSERANKIRLLSVQLGPLLRVNTLEGNAWAEKQPCRLVLPNDRPTICKIWNIERDSSMWQVSTSDKFNGVHGYCNHLPLVVETIMKPNRCNIAKALGFKLYDEDQEDYISYIKERLFCYIDDIKDYGFDHIIIIGELYYGMLFLDCFGRAFNLDSMSNTLLFLGSYFKRVERVTKGLDTKWVQWMINSNDGKIVEINGPEHYLLPVEKERMGKKNKKRSGKKHH